MSRWVPGRSTTGHLLLVAAHQCPSNHGAYFTMSMRLTSLIALDREDVAVGILEPGHFAAAGAG